MLRSGMGAYEELDGFSASLKRKPAAGSFGSMVYNTEDTAQGLTSSPESQEAGLGNDIVQGTEEVNAPRRAPSTSILIVSHRE